MSRFLETRRIAVTALALIVVSACSGGHDDAVGASASHATSVSRSAARPGQTSCSSVRYVGDSISVGLVSPKQIPTASERLGARLAGVGVRTASIDVSGGRATYERFMNRPSTLDVLPKRAGGYDGCYVFAVGTNDAGNVAVGANLSMRHRIDALMTVAGGRPVLWPKVVSKRQGTPYADAWMQKFDAELVAATKRYPNLRVYDWPAERDPAWTEPDGIHDTRRGSRERALMTAKALAVAFPAGASASSSTVVGSVAGRPASTSNRAALPGARGDGGAFWAADAAALAHYTSGPPMR